MTCSREKEEKSLEEKIGNVWKILKTKPILESNLQAWGKTWRKIWGKNRH